MDKPTIRKWNNQKVIALIAVVTICYFKANKLTKFKYTFRIRVPFKNCLYTILLIYFTNKLTLFLFDVNTFFGNLKKVNFLIEYHILKDLNKIPKHTIRFYFHKT